MNAGAARATGDVLLFLHADTRVPPNYVGHIAQTLSRPGVVAGAFTFRTDGGGPTMRFIEWQVARRCRLWQLPYGDQGLFMRADVFRAAGGFPVMPVMEDYELVRRLRSAGTITTCHAEAHTSARTWRRRGVWRTTLMHAAIVAAYRLGVSPATLVKWRTR
jgi:rSAM/selenodomain-associated transferase 2